MSKSKLALIRAAKDMHANTNSLPADSLTMNHITLWKIKRGLIEEGFVLPAPVNNEPLKIEGLEVLVSHDVPLDKFYVSSRTTITLDVPPPQSAG